ncbi:MAG: T9SS type A sorting domain-containing protein, partial [Candidatus Moranbacteria bacterium]|nr:T9SS type A sorting domain-containing protein [Candidatus Moranbacteria bacterium]
SQSIISRLSGQATPSFYLAGYQRFRQDGTSVGANNPTDMTLPRLKTVMDNVLANAAIGNKIQFVTPEQFAYLLQKKIQTTSVATISSNPDAFRVFVSNFNELNISLTDQLPGNYMIRIFDLAGREILSNNLQYKGIEMSEKISMNGLSRGIYVVNLQGSSFSSSVKVIF